MSERIHDCSGLPVAMLRRRVEEATVRATDDVHRGELAPSRWTPELWTRNASRPRPTFDAVPRPVAAFLGAFRAWEAPVLIVEEVSE